MTNYYRTILFWLFALLFFSNVSSQNNFKKYQEFLKSTKSSFSSESYIDSLITNSKETNNLNEVIEIAHSFSKKMNRIKSYDKAIKYGQLEVDSYEKLNLINSHYCNALYNLVNFYYKISEYKKAISTAKKSLELNIRFKKEALAYTLTGKCYKLLGEYNKSILYYEKGISLLEEKKQYKSLFNKYISLSRVYFELDRKKNSRLVINLLNKAKSLKEHIPLSASNLFKLNASYAIYHKNEPVLNFDKVNAYYLKSLELANVLRDPIRITQTYTNLGDLHLFNQKNKDSVKYYLNKVFKHSKNKDLKSKAHSILYDYYMLNKDLDAALLNIHKSIILQTNVRDNIKNNPTTKEIVNFKDKFGLISYLEKKAVVLIELYHKDNNLENLKLALDNLILVETLIDSSQNNTVEQNTKLFWRKESAILYYYITYCYELLGDKENYFLYLEKNKTFLLLQNVIKNTQEGNALNSHYSKKDSKLKKELFILQKKILEETDTVNLKKYQNDYFQKKIKHYDLQDSIKNIKSNNITLHKIIDLKTTQKKLESNSAIISYMWEKDENEFDFIFGLYVSKEEVKTFKIDNKKNIEKLVFDFKKKVSKPYLNERDIKHYRDTAFALYNKLFPKNIQKLIKQKKLTIFPDSHLQNIPFEALITKENSNNYLIESNEVNYAYSASFLIENSTAKRNPSKDLIGFAPQKFGYDNLSELSNSKAEILNINTYYSGLKLFDTLATKTQFLSKINNYKIIHLSTHANSNDSIAPWIAFKNEKLYLNELYTTKNQADLVVLSACETALGEINKGEGVFSLARGFFYSGANSVVSSLWSVNDKSTQHITTNFYKHLKQGKSKSAALRLSKLDYLNTHSLSEISPYYWSSLILIGNSDPIQNTSYCWLYLILVLQFIILFFLFLKKRKNLG